MPTRNPSQVRQRLFLLGAGFNVAHQVAGKAVRDGLFLSCFAPRDLPKVMVCAALVSVVLGVGFSRLLAKHGPLRLVPGAFALGAILHLLEFSLLRWTGEAMRGVVITLVYLHLMGFGAILLSGFWSVASELLDPREAKREFGRIAAAGTFGGICGGLMAERGAALFGGEPLLLLLAGFHLIAFLAVGSVSASGESAISPETDDEPWQAARDAFRQAPFLLSLSAVLLIGTVSATLLDYLFKSGAAATFGKGPQLTRYFALFYTGSMVLTLLAQHGLMPVALQRLGLGRTMQCHSGTVAICAGASILLPPVVMAPVSRALELVLRGSFLRSSYELFFTPVPPREKRATKMLIDVGCDRMGDALAAGLLQLLLLLGPRQAVAPILVVTGALGVAGFYLTRRMDAAYSGAMERGLMSRAEALQEPGQQESLTLAALWNTTVSFPRNADRDLTPAPESRIYDPVVARLGELRSGVPRRIQAALAPDQPFDPVLLPAAVRLLAWDQSFESARAFLLRHAHRAIGQLVDVLLDQEHDLSVRKRIPHLLAYTSSQRAVEGLTIALGDPRFEVRYQASRALEFLHRMAGGLRFDHESLRQAVEAELSIPQSKWQGRKVWDSRGSNEGQDWYLDEVLRDRADKSLEHVFSLLAISLPPEPLKVAFRALHSPDRLLKALALEFLESHIPAELVSKMRNLAPPAATADEPEPAAQGSLAGQPQYVSGAKYE